MEEYIGLITNFFLASIPFEFAEVTEVTETGLGLSVKTKDGKSYKLAKRLWLSEGDDDRFSDLEHQCILLQD